MVIFNESQIDAVSSHTLSAGVPGKGLGNRCRHARRRGPCLAVGRMSPVSLTLHLGLVDEEVFGGAAALELLTGAFLGAELLILALVQGEERGGEAAAAGGPGQGRQRVLLRGRAEG